ncbi:hypothetical protein [uncultured Caulobacter sp.]|uniref:DUF6881 domain-containing protein n=1 Tax=uncultured Caulobacter sp. TaxID=158749 RepID=UPI0026065E58|nr:hypothetical protein [uncultured Caulobacter sp.]
MIVSHYRCDWRHRPNEEPVAIFYEVDGGGAVPRLIDVFADGQRRRESALEQGVASLVDGSFHESAALLLAGHAIEDGDERLTLTPITAEAFEIAWKIAGGH